MPPGASRYYGSRARTGVASSRPVAHAGAVNAPQVLVERPDRSPARIDLVLGDITTAHADAIVNAANSALAGGGGVDGAIHRAAGPEVMADLDARYDRCPTGSAVITCSGRLAAHGVRWIVHAVGPVWNHGRNHEAEHLRSAYTTALALADEAGATTVALPAISCGVYGYPLPEASAVALRAVRDGLAAARNLEHATFVLYSDDTYAAFRGALEELAAEG
jgi:O-acetyl-ADP-ribose deacetylase